MEEGSRRSREAREKGRQPKVRDLRVAVIGSFPTPNGTHLRKLLLSEEISTTRLQKIINVYQVAGKILAFTVLSQLWDECHKNKGFKWQKGAREIVQAYFDLEIDREIRYNYIVLTKAISDLFVLNKVEPFILDKKVRLHSQPYDFCKTSYIAPFCRNWVGVSLVCFLNAVLKDDLELKPTSYKISKTVYSFLDGFLSIFLASSILYSFTKSKKC